MVRVSRSAERVHMYMHIHACRCTYMFMYICICVCTYIKYKYSIRRHTYIHVQDTCMRMLVHSRMRVLAGVRRPGVSHVKPLRPELPKALN